MSTPKLGADAIKTIWSWANQKELFFKPGGEPTKGEHEASVPPGGALFFNSVCSLLKKMEQQNQVDTVRMRLLLYFLARFVDERCEGAQEDVVVFLLVDSGWISKTLQPYLEMNLKKWLAAGRVYARLVELLGVGAGILIFLPLFGSSTWEQKCSLVREQGEMIAYALHRLGVLEAASVIRDDNRSAHAVVQEIVQHLFEQSPNLVMCNISAAFGPLKGKKRIRRPRSTQSRRLRRRLASPRRPPDDASSGSELSWPVDSVYSPSPAGTETPETASEQSEYCRVLPVDPRLQGTPPAGGGVV